MTVAVRTRIRACVRCGEAPRDADTFICSSCRNDPRTKAEAEAARAADPQHPRFVLIQRGWAGGWARDKAGPPV